MNTEANSIPLTALPPMSLDAFVEHVGISSATAWRWRQRGWLRTINICGRQYVPRAEIVLFNERAAKGEFSKEVKHPMRTKGRI